MNVLQQYKVNNLIFYKMHPTVSFFLFNKRPQFIFMNESGGMEQPIILEGRDGGLSKSFG